MTKRLGATQDEWTLFARTMKLSRDLLPVVSNPEAKISPQSKMQGVGKTPSRYNSAGFVAGIPDWTAHNATPAEVKKWSAQPDYGICIQTRDVRGLDVDVDDKEKADAIYRFIADWLFENCNDVPVLPKRFRANSGKFLLGFRLDGPLPKRAVHVGGGLIEFLATGQQFVAAGTHSSGARIEWQWAGCTDFPRLSLDDFDALWLALVSEFGLDDGVTLGYQPRLKGEHLDIADDVAQKLIEKGLILEEGRDGQLHLDCPFKDGHSSDSGVTEFSYFPAGTNGYQQGHFKCLHTSCSGRTDIEFAEALGVGPSSDFDVVEPDPAKPPPKPKLIRGGKNGDEVKAIGPNLQVVIPRADMTGYHVHWDDFRAEIVYKLYGKPKMNWTPFGDQDYFKIQCQLERDHGFQPIGKDLLRQAVFTTAWDNRIDTAIEWLDSLTWDGVDRISHFCRDYFGAKDTAYTRAVGNYIWSALAGRVLEPGVKADMVPVLISPQGRQKSWGMSALAPGRDSFTEIDLMERDDNLARKMRGKLVIEIPELRGLHSRDQESIKAFITRTEEEWVPKYQEFSKRYYRRFIFMATHNKQEFLADTTGNRRWLPILITQIRRDQIEKDRDQLWAQAATLFRAKGVCWRAAEELAAKVHDDHRMSDTWADEIAAWLDTVDEFTGRAPSGSDFTIRDVMQGALGLDLRQEKRQDVTRVADILRELGYERKRSTGGKKVWKKTGAESANLQKNTCSDLC